MGNMHTSSARCTLNSNINSNGNMTVQPTAQTSVSNEYNLNLSYKSRIQSILSSPYARFSIRQCMLFRLICHEGHCRISRAQ